MVATKTWQQAEKKLINVLRSAPVSIDCLELPERKTGEFSPTITFFEQKKSGLINRSPI